MTKEEMLKEIKFPVIGNTINNFVGLIQGNESTYPAEDSWIMCFVDIEGMTNSLGLYKWQKENNPQNIHGYCYIDINAISGTALYIYDEEFQDEKVIIIRDKKYKDYKLKHDK